MKRQVLMAALLTGLVMAAGAGAIAGIHLSTPVPQTSAACGR